MANSQPEQVVNPHDAYVTSVFRQISEARAFFRGHLPSDLEALFDWRTLRLESAKFITEELGRQYADLLFSVRMRGEKNDRRIRLVFEHKSDVRYKTPRQIHQYAARQFEDTPLDQPLPPVITVLLLQSGSWRRSTEFAAEYGLADNVLAVLRPYLVNFRMVITELGPMTENQMRGTAEGRFALALLKSVGENKPLGWTAFESILTELCQEDVEPLRRILTRAWSYLSNVISDDQQNEVQAKLKSLPKQFKPLENTMVTLQQHWINEGVKQGVKQGDEQGMLRTLDRMLPLVYPEYTGNDDRLTKLSAKDLDKLLSFAAARKSWKQVEKLLNSGDASK